MLEYDDTNSYVYYCENVIDIDPLDEWSCLRAIQYCIRIKILGLLMAIRTCYKYLVLIWNLVVLRRYSKASAAVEKRESLRNISSRRQDSRCYIAKDLFQVYRLWQVFCSNFSASSSNYVFLPSLRIHFVTLHHSVIDLSRIYAFIYWKLVKRLGFHYESSF